MDLVKKNYIYNIILALINIAYPLITAPYVSIVLGAANLGKVIEIQAFTSFMMFFSYFGIQTYGIREIAKYRSNKEKLSMVYSELMIIQLIATLVSLIIYGVISLFYYRTTTDYMLLVIYFFSLAFNIFSIDWAYSGIEEFKVITIRTAIIKILTLALMFALIKSANDYTMYSFIGVIATIIVNVISCVYISKIIKFKFKGLSLKKHINSLMLFFITSITLGIYSLLDQVMLGVLSTKESVAYLNRAKQIFALIIVLTNSLSKVLLPRLTKYYNDDRKQYIKLVNQSINFMFIICLPSIAGIALLSNEIMFLLGGTEFANASEILIVMSPWLLIVSLATLTDNQISIPTGNEKITTIASVAVASISLILNIILIPKFSFMGSAIAYVIAEFIGLIIQVILTKQKVEYKIISKDKIKYIISTIIMSLVILVLKNEIKNIFVRIIVIIPVASFIYFVILLLLKDEFCINILKKIIVKAEKRLID